MTPLKKRIHIRRAVARGSRMAIVTHCLKDATVRQHIITKVGNLLQSEVATLCSNRCNSALRCPSNEHILSFEWVRVLQQMQEHALILLSLLRSATQTKHERPNQDAVIAMCTAIMGKLRSSEVNVAQKTLSLLFGGHASKQVRMLI